MLTCGEDLIEDYVDRYVARQSEQEGIERERKDRQNGKERDTKEQREKEERKERERVYFARKTARDGQRDSVQTAI